jgi:hypothetical protein
MLGAGSAGSRLALRGKARGAVTREGSAGVLIGMRIYVRLMLLIAFAVVLPGGLVLLPLAYTEYRKVSGCA